MKVLAPGKLILSGEHSVVYGQPALAMAVNRYVVATVIPQMFSGISFDLLDFRHEKKFTLQALEHLKNQIKLNYNRFMQGELKIRDVLKKPGDLVQFAFILFFETLKLKLAQGIKIRLQSDIPIGCGMGSSAAAILSIFHALASHLRIEHSADLFFRLGLEAENMQHGYSSGLDLRVSLQGGCLYVNDGRIYPRTLPSLPLYLVNTGTPQNTTGECVTNVAHHFKKTSLGDDFAAVTNAMDSALQLSQNQEVMRAMTENHNLLSHIGIVPDIVQRFVRDIQQTGGAGKVCGAGTVTGNSAGIVLVVTENEVALNALCIRYGYAVIPVLGEPRGVHVI